MKLTIFSRMVIALLAIFMLSMAVSAYTIYQLNKLEDITKSIYLIDNQAIELENKLSDVLASMIGSGEKYIITRDKEIKENFSKDKEVFEKYLDEITAITDTEKAHHFLTEIRENYQTYLRQWQAVAVSLESKEGVPIDAAAEEEKKNTRDKVVDAIMGNLKELMIYSKTDKIIEKIVELNKKESRSIKVVIGITITSLILILIISILITINITRPLAAMKKKTREIARGDYGDQLELSSPPEIQALEQAFNIMSTRLQELDTMKTDFFSLMSHELRTPLASIKEATNLLIESLKQEKITERQQKLFSIMKEENNRLIKLVNSLLDLSKMEAGMMIYAFNRSDLLELIKRAFREIEPLAEAKNITVTIEADKGLPLIRVDNERILQVLRNLIGNAVKFTPKGGQVGVLVNAFEQGIKVSVSDTGVGIAQESLMTIFDKFQQEDVLTHFHKIKGTGLGLSLVKHIIKAHGGRVWAESTLGQGSTFTFVLPA